MLVRGFAKFRQMLGENFGGNDSWQTFVLTKAAAVVEMSTS